MAARSGIGETAVRRRGRSAAFAALAARRGVLCRADRLAGAPAEQRGRSAVVVRVVRPDSRRPGTRSLRPTGSAETRCCGSATRRSTRRRERRSPSGCAFPPATAWRQRLRRPACAADHHDGRHADPGQRARAAAVPRGERRASAVEPARGDPALRPLPVRRLPRLPVLRHRARSRPPHRRAHRRLRRMAGVSPRRGSARSACRRVDRRPRLRRELDELLPAVGHVRVARIRPAATPWHSASQRSSFPARPPEATSGTSS